MLAALLTSAALTTPTLASPPPASPLHRLVAIGSTLNWPGMGAAQLDVHVRQTGPVTITLQRPGFDASDYRLRRSGPNDDEQYGTTQPDTTFTLRDPSGRVVTQRTFSPRERTTTPFLTATLTPGTYTLTMTVSGPVKRVAGAWIAGPVDVQTRTTTRTVQGRTWTAAQRVDLARPATLRLYGGDQAGELELRLRLDDGRVLPLNPGRRGEWVTMTLPAGQGVIEARQGTGRLQWTKTFALALLDGGVPAPQVLQRWTPPTPPLAPTAVTVTPQIVEVTDRTPAPQPTQIIVIRDATPPVKADLPITADLPGQAAAVADLGTTSFTDKAAALDRVSEGLAPIIKPGPAPTVTP